MGRSRVKWGKMDDTSSPETYLSRTENGPLQLQVGREDVDGDNFSQQLKVIGSHISSQFNSANIEASFRKSN